MVFRFSNCKLDPDRRELFRKGESVHVEPQVFDVLCHLVQNCERAVSRDELIEKVWDGRCVTDATVSARIASARRAVGDTGDSQSVIRTIPRYGFRIVAPVTTESDGNGAAADAAVGLPPIETAESETAWHRAERAATGRPAVLVLGVVLVIAALTMWFQVRPGTSGAVLNADHGSRSIAVVPFGTPGGDAEEDRFLAEGLAEEITIELSRNADLTVLARSAAFEVAGIGSGPADVARSLGVQYVLDGTVRRVGDELRISAVLVSRTNGETVWSERYSADAKTLFDVQEEIVETISGTLLSSVRETEKREMLRRPPGSLDAYELSLRGVARKHRLNADDAELGRAELRLALEIDPELAQAWMTLGWIEAIGVSFGWIEDVTLEEATAKIEKAIELDPMLPTAYQALGIAKGFGGDAHGALAAAQRSVELAPGDADNLLFLGRALASSGRFEEAERHARRAMILNPGRPSYYSYNLGRILWAREAYAEALALEKECLTKAPAFTGCQIFAVASAVGSGDPAAASEYVGKLLKTTPGYSIEAAVSAIGFPAMASANERLGAQLAQAWQM